MGHPLRPLLNLFPTGPAKGGLSQTGSSSADVEARPPKELFQDYSGIQENFTEGNPFLKEDGIANTCDLKLNIIKDTDIDQILRNYQFFNQFDCVEDNSDHHYLMSSCAEQPSKLWLKTIEEEWKILKENLPDTISVRVYESRMDLLRAVIIGADGTPYHDGLFFFDIFFPQNYPDAPPEIYYHSRGLQINPNFEKSGTICLSLLNTWIGDRSESWIPRKSTVWQVLVSIQGLILNDKPYFNEFGYDNEIGMTRGELMSQLYNEATFVMVLRTMSCTLRTPPKHFEDFVVGHFHKRAHDILAACKVYMHGALVGSFVKGQGQDVGHIQRNCSVDFKQLLANHSNALVKDFESIGVQGCEKFPDTSKSKE